MGKEPFEREALVELQELAEAGRKEFVAHQRAVGRRDAVVGEVGLEAAAAGADAFGAGGE